MSTNPEKILRNGTRRKAIRRHRKRVYVLEYMASHPCVDCGEQDPVVLDFDHRGDKKHEVSRMTEYGEFQAMVEEIEKCDVRCSNCHRRRHYGANTYKSKTIEQLDKEMWDRWQWGRTNPLWETPIGRNVLAATRPLSLNDYRLKGKTPNQTNHNSNLLLYLTAKVNGMGCKVLARMLRKSPANISEKWHAIQRRLSVDGELIWPNLETKGRARAPQVPNITTQIGLAFA